MSQKTKKNRGIKLIKKSNDLIEARYRFDIWESRVFTSVLSEIDQSDEDFRVYRIYLRDIIKEFGINNGDAYEMLRQATHNLMNKKFYVNYEQDGALRERIYHIIRKADVMKEALDESKRKINEYVDISIEPEMKPLLLELKSRFTTYDMQNVVRFKSSYTLRIYEHLKQYEKIGRRTLDIEYLKRIFELTTEYPLFANFYQKVIEPAHRDINEFTDLTITEIEKVKNGKKVERLLFTFHSKKRDEQKLMSRGGVQTKLNFGQSEPLPPAKNEATQQAEKDKLFLQFQSVVVGEFGVSPTVFLQELTDCTEARVEQTIRIVRRAKAEAKVKNLPGFFIEALRKSFTDAKEEQGKKQKQADESAAILRGRVAALEEEKNNHINERIRELVGLEPELTELAIHEIHSNVFCRSYIETKESFLGRPLAIEDFRQDRTLREWVKSKIVELRKGAFEEILMSYEDKMQEIKSSLSR
jgi:plasmid replication initiation protein